MVQEQTEIGIILYDKDKTRVLFEPARKFDSKGSRVTEKIRGEELDLAQVLDLLGMKTPVEFDSYAMSKFGLRIDRNHFKIKITTKTIETLER